MARSVTKNGQEVPCHSGGGRYSGSITGDIALSASEIKSQKEKKRFVSRIIFGLFSTVTGTKTALLAFAFKKDSGAMQKSAFIDNWGRCVEKKARS